MPVLVIAEHDHQTLKPVTLNVITAAAQLGVDIHVLIAGTQCAAVAAAAASVVGVKKVLHADHAGFSHFFAETLANLLQGLAPAYSHLLAPATAFGKNVLPRVAGLLDVSQISDVTAILDASTFRRPVYAGNAIATVRSNDTIKLLTVRGTAFEPAAASGNNAPIELVAGGTETSQVQFVSSEMSKSERPELTTARVVVSGGRGMGSAENFALLEALADRLGGAVGASRAAVDAGYAANDSQVGQTGKIVAPDLYIAAGISGAIQHLAGMKDSKIIVAINKDPEAPIFQVADYGLVADLFEAVPELTKKL
ncbi:MAG: FAD-binding protein [Alphaproteobacteria bacterium]|nr:FAD-binding protein [Alphaproteobacteria bacterium]